MNRHEPPMDGASAVLSVDGASAVVSEDGASAVVSQDGAVVGRGLPHESAHLHVAGAAPYIDDLPELAGTLHAALGRAMAEDRRAGLGRQSVHSLRLRQQGECI